MINKKLSQEMEALDRAWSAMEDSWFDVRDSASRLTAILEELTDEDDEDEDERPARVSQAPATEDDARALAEAVLQFADWQWGGYVTNVSPEARRTVGRQLWSEVSARVHKLTGKVPSSPRADRERDDARADRTGRL